LFLPLVSGFPDGSSDGLLIGLLPRPSAHQWLAVQIARRLISSFLPLINGLPDSLPDGSLVGLLHQEKIKKLSLHVGKNDLRR